MGPGQLTKVYRAKFEVSRAVNIQSVVFFYQRTFVCKYTASRLRK